MKKIIAFEKAIENQVRNLKNEGINPTLFWAYRESVKAENELLNFAGVIWDDDIEDIVKCLKENGICEFTISSSFSGLIKTLAEFQKNGYHMDEITEVNANYTDLVTGNRARVQAIVMRRI